MDEGWHLTKKLALSYLILHLKLCVLIYDIWKSEIIFEIMIIVVGTIWIQDKAVGWPGDLKMPI